MRLRCDDDLDTATCRSLLNHGVSGALSTDRQSG
jgi:hypothetical protein